MKKILKSVLAVTLAFLTVFITPVRTIAEAASKTYISEVKVGIGDDAKSDLEGEGFTVLCDEKGNPIDLNQDAGGGMGSQGNKKVLMGYKTTTNISEAVTDLAVMNMCGGYSVQEYDLLMKRYLGAQIAPFIDKFIVAINEYRENIKSDDAANRQRAEYIRKALNKFTDDDCGGAGLGDLLLNETVYEMAKPKFDRLSEAEKLEKGISGVNAEVRDALPEAEKNKHCDMLTLFGQADGQIMLVIYDLITRGADTADDSWIDRFTAMTYDDLLDSYDMTPTDAEKAAALDFEDDAKMILQNWEDFRTLLLSSDEAVETVNNAETPDVDAMTKKIDKLDDNSSDKEIVEAVVDVLEVQAQTSEIINATAGVTVADYLESIEYGDGTLYDFFTRSSAEMAADITSLYPMAAALSAGQRAGLEFISLREMVMLANRDAEYSDVELEGLMTVSVYEGVNRELYRKGGVALTSDTLRTQAMEQQKNLADRSLLSTKTIVLWAVTGAMAVGFIGSAVAWGVRASKIASEKALLSSMDKAIDGVIITNDGAYRIMQGIEIPVNTIKVNGVSYTPEAIDNAQERLEESIDEMTSQFPTAKWMSVGFAAATVILSAVSAYMSWKDLKDYYKVDFTPIPHYMVDEVSITYVNDKNEKVFKPNQAAYYEAVRCFRKEGDKNYKALDDCADLNGEVGQQWLALYVCKNPDEMQPILADSLKVVVGSNNIPAGYDNRGIHMFGSESAFNLNNKLYDWNQSAKSVFVYFKLDTSVTPGASTSGSAFSGGVMALIGVGCAGLGAALTALGMTAYGKRKKEPAAA